MIDDIKQGGDPRSDAEAGLDRLLDFLREARGFDFTGYKRSSLARRIRRRMDVSGIDTFGRYLIQLERDRGELGFLFDSLFVNATAFFRDPLAWRELEARLPGVIDLEGTDPIRVWSAGCSSGEEAYTLAIVLAEALGEAVFANRVRIYATDVDMDALARARQAIYAARAMAAVPPGVVEKYFTRAGDDFVFRKDLRRSVVFGRHDLAHDVPLTKLDVLACRNTLLHFNVETQQRVFERLQFALNPGGLLFLGNAEMLAANREMFSLVEPSARIFERTAPPARSRVPAAAAVRPPDTFVRALARGDLPVDRVEAAYRASPLAQLVVDAFGKIVLANERAKRMFSADAPGGGRGACAVLGGSLRQLEASWREDGWMRVEAALAERRTAKILGVERVSPDGSTVHLDVDVRPLFASTGLFLGALVSFTERTRVHQARLDLRCAEAELDAARDALEAANDELHAVVEELETAKEALRSSNEDLAVLNEELQSTNTELQTMNEELRRRGAEVNELNALYSCVVASLPTALAVLDEDLNVRTWNPRMEELWGTLAVDAVGRHVSKLDLGVPSHRLVSLLCACIAEGQPVRHRVDWSDSRGARVARELTFVPLRRDRNEGAAVIAEEVRG